MHSKFITTPIYYANAAPHIGHVYTTLLADTLTRFHRLKGRDVFFLTGVDEHGIKVQRSAENNQVSPQEHVDKYAHIFKDLFQKLDTLPDRFIRTTDTDHHKAAQALWQAMYDNGYIYKGKYAGWYAAQDECFYEEAELIQGKAPTGAPVEFIEEESFYFKLSAFQEKLLEFYKENPNFVFPKERFAEVISFVEQGLNDLSISRRSVSWGVPVPQNPEHTMYVWVDALCNYITALGYPDTTTANFQSFWPESYHIIGKDISRFHAIFWPAFLMAANLAPPKKIVTHGWWICKGAKMSKSIGNVIDPFLLLESVSSDALRYFMLRETSLHSDGNFSEAALIQRYNSDLANDLGNLLSRTTSMYTKHKNHLKNMYYDSKFLQGFYTLSEPLSHHIENFNFNQYCASLWDHVRSLNQYIDQHKPWTLVKNEQYTETSSVLFSVLEGLRCVALFALPILPRAATRILETLGVPQNERSILCANADYALALSNKIHTPDALFPRIDIQKAED